MKDKKGRTASAYPVVMRTAYHPFFREGVVWMAFSLPPAMKPFFALILAVSAYADEPLTKKQSFHFTVNGPGVLFDDVRIWAAK
ncbi:MAG: hypothetical protein IPK32_11240 [Verrucomicrobiaceae bacterium]|nr:hypothetical protein [Verrucomicrobiaceae bacterium]